MICAPLSDGRWQYDYGLTNIEYTEFDRLGITDQPLEGASGAAQLSVFPANTNVLYVDLHAAEAIVQKVRLAPTIFCQDMFPPFSYQLIT